MSLVVNAEQTEVTDISIEVRDAAITVRATESVIVSYYTSLSFFLEEAFACPCFLVSTFFEHRIATGMRQHAINVWPSSGNACMREVTDQLTVTVSSVVFYHTMI